MGAAGLLPMCTFTVPRYFASPLAEIRQLGGSSPTFVLVRRLSALSGMSYYTSQTVEQMQNMVPLTLTAPPARANIFIPGCSGADENYACTWNGFSQTLKNTIDPAFIQ